VSAGELVAEATQPALAAEPDLLTLLRADLHRSGLVGEDDFACLVCLATVSRLLQQPVSLAGKGPSAAGKSFTMMRVLSFFPPSAYYALSAMSERALVYSEESLVHRMLVLYEAAGLTGDLQTYLLRSLLSEGRIRYETVDRRTLKPRFIEKEGPTGLLVTTTQVALHAENETRLLSVAANDTPEQTRRVLLSLADDEADTVDRRRGFELHEWLAREPHDVVVPFRRELAQLVPPVAIRLRRDFGSVLNLVRAHALLHRGTRQMVEGRIVATFEDYEAVRELVAGVIADGVEATVAPSVRETVRAVESLTASGETCSVAEVGRELVLDKSAASRRVAVATRRGYLVNLEDRRGKPARLKIGDPLPEDVPILPAVEALRDRCTVAVAIEERESSTPELPHSLRQERRNTATVGQWPSERYGMESAGV
jgi:hypothetical protein